MKSEYARSHRGFAATVVGLMVVFCLSLTALAFAAPGASHSKSTDLAPKQSGSSAKLSETQVAQLLKSPLSFEANQGQTDNHVKFSARGQGYGIYLTASDVFLALRKGKDGKPVVLRMTLSGAKATPQVTAVDKLDTVVNYFKGNDPSKWRTNVPTYGKVKYESVYPGVDLVFYGNQRQLEYDFVVAPGIDPSRIKFNIDGAEKLAVDNEGHLALGVAGGELRFLKPHVYQMVKGVKREIAGGYVISGGREVAFEVGKYNKQLALVIDPMLDFNTYLGGTGTDVGNAIALNSVSRAFVIGNTFSTDLSSVLGVDENCLTCGAGSPLEPPAPSISGTLGDGEDAFLVEVRAGGTGLGSWTYFGGGGLDSGNGVAVDSSNNIYVTGSTTSTDFPLLSPIQGVCGGASANCGSGVPDAYVAKFNYTFTGNPYTTIALAYSTYLGGGGADAGNGIAVDAAFQAAIVGNTGSVNMGTTGVIQQSFGGGSTDAFVAELNAAGSAVNWFTYLGGSGDDSGKGIAAHPSNGFAVIGQTSSATLPFSGTNTYQNTHVGAIDAFVVILNATATSSPYATYLGGTGDDYGNAITAEYDDTKSTVYVTGTTGSGDFPTSTGAYQTAKSAGRDAFVTELDTNVNGSGSLLYSTFLGGTGDDAGNGIALETFTGAVRPVVVGETSSTDFPRALPSLIDGSMPPGGCLIGGGGDTADAYVTKLNPAGSGASDLLMSSCFGGGAADGANAVVVRNYNWETSDTEGAIYLTGGTTSPDIPTPNITGPRIFGSLHFKPRLVALRMPLWRALIVRRCSRYPRPARTPSAMAMWESTARLSQSP